MNASLGEKVLSEAVDKARKTCYPSGRPRRIMHCLVLNTTEDAMADTLSLDGLPPDARRALVEIHERR